MREMVAPYMLVALKWGMVYMRTYMATLSLTLQSG